MRLRNHLSCRQSEQLSPRSNLATLLSVERHRSEYTIHGTRHHTFKAGLNIDKLNEQMDNLFRTLRIKNFTSVFQSECLKNEFVKKAVKKRLCSVEG